METKQLRIMENVISRVAKAAKFHQVIESLERPRPMTVMAGSAYVNIHAKQDVKLIHMHDTAENPVVDYYVFQGGYTVDYPSVISRS